MNKRIILAAGHGGGDPGAGGQGTNEAAECVQIVNRLADKLRRDGRIEVHVVPHELNLGPSIDWVNARWKNVEDGLCIEVHKNATVNAHGIEAWHYGGDSHSAHLGNLLLDGCGDVPGMPRVRGNFPDTQNRHGSLGWVRQTNPWAILMEMGFVSDGGDGVDDNADNIYAEGLYRGILKCMDLGLQAAPAPLQPPANLPKTTWRTVSMATGKQTGAYNTEAAAWNKYLANSGGDKILRVSDGVDVTHEFVAKFRPTQTAPQNPNPPHPELVNQKLDQIIAELGLVKGLVQWVVDKLKGVFK